MKLGVGRVNRERGHQEAHGLLRALIAPLIVAPGILGKFHELRDLGAALVGSLGFGGDAVAERSESRTHPWMGRAPQGLDGLIHGGMGLLPGDRIADRIVRGPEIQLLCLREEEPSSVQVLLQLSCMPRVRSAPQHRQP